MVKGALAASASRLRQIRRLRLLRQNGGAGEDRPVPRQARMRSRRRHGAVSSYLARTPGEAMSDSWHNGIDEAAARMREHLGSKASHIKFDTRDRAALNYILNTLDARRSKVWTVRFSNYEPPEVEGLYATEQLAKERARQLSGMWEVGTMTVRTELPEDEP